MSFGIPKPKSKPAEKRDKLRARDKAWQQARNAVLVRDGFRCRACGTGGKYGLDVHHIKLRSAGRDDSVANLATLCRICHAEIHAYRLSLSGDANKQLRIERSA